MTRRRNGYHRTVRLTLLIAACLLAPAAARAQAWDAWGGYSLLRETKDQITFPAGWAGGGSVSVGPRWLAVLVDVDGQRKAIPSIGSDIVLTTHAFTAGARAAAALGRFTQFAQISAGVLRTSGDAFGSTDTATSLVLQPGLGLDYPIAGSLAGRVQLDVRWLHTGQQVRVVGAVVYRRR